MASKIKNLNFKNCQHLRKLLIEEGVEFDGAINLKDTPIKTKNDISKTRLKGWISSSADKFINLPVGITTTVNNYQNRIKMKPETKNIETQTEAVEIAPLNSLILDQKEKNLLGIMKECLFWYDEFDDPKRKQYLIQKQQELNQQINATTTIPLNNSVRLLGEHILLIVEKLIENAEHFSELNQKSNKEQLDLEPRSWLGFYLWLLSDMVWKYEERMWRWQTTSDLVQKLVYGKVNRVLYRSPSDETVGTDEELYITD